MAGDTPHILRRYGIQVTAQRLAVLRAVVSQPHATADNIVDIVRAAIGAVAHQAVYDALGFRVAQSLVRRIQPAGSPARFEARVGDNHHHVICRVCGRSADVDCAIGFAPCLTPAAKFRTLSRLTTAERSGEKTTWMVRASARSPQERGKPRRFETGGRTKWT